MAIYNDVRPIIAHQFNREYGTTLEFKDLRIEAISDNDVPDMLKYNTIVSVSGAGKEPLSIFYNRADIDTVVIGKRNMLMPDKNNDSIHALLPAINKVFGLDLTIVEINDAPVSKTNGDIDIIIADSINFIKGSKFTITIDCGMVVDNVPHHLYSLFGDFERPDIYQKPCMDPLYTDQAYGTATTFAGLMTANVDYTPIAYILRNVGVSEQYYGDDRLHMAARNTLGHAFAAIRTVDGNPWINDGPGMYNTYAWYPVYNGSTAECKGMALRHAAMDYTAWIDTPEALAAIDLVNTDYDNVLIIRQTPSSNNSGVKITHMVCHYNGAV